MKINENGNKLIFLTTHCNVDRHAKGSDETTELPCQDPHCLLIRVRTVCERT